MTKATFLAFSCVHCPLQDEAAVDWMLGRVADLKPDVIVHLGDGHEADSASRWPSEYTWGIKDEFAAHNDFLASVRKVAKRKARLIFLPGNHDANFQEVGRIPVKLKGACDYRDPVHEPELQNWEQPCVYEYHRTRGVFRLGNVSFAHGFESGRNADRVHAVMLGNPYGLFVGGHLHRPTPIVQRVHLTPDVPLPYWYANAGTLRNMDCSFMKRKRKHLWGQGIVRGECDLNAAGRMEKSWSAAVEIFRMSDSGEEI